MSLSDMFFACGMCVDVCERQIYFDEFLAVFRHGVERFVVVCGCLNGNYRLFFEVV